MAAMAYGYAHSTRFEGDGVGWFAAWRIRRLEKRLVPVWKRFFDDYCRGGTRPGVDLVIDYDFVLRPRVRAVLRGGAAGRPLDTATLEEEYLAWDRAPDLAKFRANVAHLHECLTS